MARKAYAYVGVFCRPILGPRRNVVSIFFFNIFNVCVANNCGPFCLNALSFALIPICMSRCRDLECLHPGG